MTTTTTTIWRARCSRCQAERRLGCEPGFDPNESNNDCDAQPDCDGCGYRIESGWRLYEVSEERGWACGDSGVISEEDARKRAVMFGRPVRRLVRRTLRRVG